MKEKLKRLIKKKRFWIFSGLTGILLLLYFFRGPVLHSIYNYLNVGEEPQMTYDYGIILGGEPLDRPKAAAELYHTGKVKKLICTGSQIPRALEAVGIMQTEAEATRSRLINLDVPEYDILMLPVATSTREEADAINTLFANQTRGKLLIITTETHTRRALRVFKEYCDPWDEMDAYGVAPTSYESKIWWKSEFGFLAVFEEYVKLVYYWFAY